MSPFTEQSIFCTDSAQGHSLHYRQWGDPHQSRVLICVHGLTRNSHDFDVLASHLAQEYRVICPDIPGRGDSDWLAQAQDYNYPQYVSDILTLLKHLELPSVDWLGTSMGGLIGMMLAAQENSPIQRLILNDIGAFLPQAAFQRIADYLNTAKPDFADLTEAEQYLRDVHAPFGALSDEQWQHLARHSTTKQANGTYRLHYDPQIGAAFQSPIEDVPLWPVWQAVRCPALLLHGVNSDLLLPETIEQMQQIHAALQVIHITDTGHAPALMNAEQRQYIQDFLYQ